MLALACPISRDESKNGRRCHALFRLSIVRFQLGVIYEVCSSGRNQEDTSPHLKERPEMCVKECVKPTLPGAQELHKS